MGENSSSFPLPLLNVRNEFNPTWDTGRTFSNCVALSFDVPLLMYEISDI